MAKVSRFRVFLAELKRRKVSRVAAWYLGVGGAVALGVPDLFSALLLPAWSARLVIVLIAVGFPIALALAWAFEVRPEESRSTAVQPLPTVGKPGEAPRHSIVVLPFDNLSPDPGDAYLSDGLTEEIITGLSCCGPLRVISRNSARVLKGTDKDTRAIAEELAVEYVLEGSVRKAGNDLRVNAQLIDGRTDEHVWAERYTGTLEDVFDMQESLSRAIVNTLRLKLDPDEEKKLSARPIKDAQAYECYLRARHQMTQYTEEALDRARQHLQNGLDLIGNNAVLLAGMGYAYSQYANIGLGHEEYIDKAEEYAKLALKLDPDSPEAHLVLGFTNQAFRGDQRTSMHHLSRALAQNPDDPDTLMWLIVGYSLAGRTDEAYPLAERVALADPLSPMGTWGKPFLDVMGGRFDVPSEDVVRVHRQEPQNPLALFFSTMFLIYCGRPQEARTLLEDSAVPAATTLVPRACLLVRLALDGASTRFADLVTEDLLLTIRRDPQWSYFMAGLHALTGHAETALDLLDNAVERGFINYPFLAEHDLTLEPLRDLPRFQATADAARREWERFELPTIP